MDNGFTFGKRSTRDFPIMKVEKYPASYGAVKKFETYSVPGRNGDLHVFENAFQNYVQPYECYYHTDRMTNEAAHEVKQWLLANAGYQRLTDAYDPNHYRLATVLTEVKIENRLNRYGRFTVNFNCDPRSFLRSGDFAQVLETATVISNPYGFAALPVIKIYGTGDGTITVAGVTVKLYTLEDHITLDCETQNAYRENGSVLENMNMHIFAPEFPELKPGKNAVSWAGGVERVEITPRWWTV